MNVRINNTFTASSGIAFRAEIVLTGMTYGLNNCLTHDKPEPMVEFIDTRYNQFVSRYYIDTLLDGRGRESGLNLNGGVPDWSIDAGTYQHVLDWLTSLHLTPNTLPVGMYLTQWELLRHQRGEMEAQTLLDGLVHDAFENSVAEFTPSSDMDEAALDALYDSAGQDASTLNNQGAEAQIAWLVKNGYATVLYTALFTDN